MNLWILSYHFPPHNIVSSRRWSKFAKYLVLAGHRVTVISAKAPKNASSPWDSDVLPTLRIHRIPYRYPRILDEEPRTKIRKAKYKIALLIVRLLAKGNPYDRAQFWERPLMKKLSSILKSEGPPDVVFANGPPFRVLYFATQFKQQSEKTRVVCDFRDPWIGWCHMGYSNLSERDQRIEEQMEKAVVSTSDVIITPAEHLKSELEKKYPEYKDKFRVIPHGFDPDVFPPEKDARRRIPPRRFVFYGSLYPRLENLILPLAKALARGKGDVTLDVYSFTEKYKDIFLQNDCSRSVQYLKLVPERELLAKLASYDFALLFTLPGIHNFVATKYFEITHARLPILLLGPSGYAAEFIQKHRLGLHFQEMEIEKKFADLLSGELKLNYNQFFNTSPYSFQQQVADLLRIGVPISNQEICGTRLPK